MTVPIRHKGLGKPKILDVEIDNSTAWGRKHITTIRQLYAKAPYLGRYLPKLKNILEQPWVKLVE